MPQISKRYRPADVRCPKHWFRLEPISQPGGHAPKYACPKCLEIAAARPRNKRGGYYRPYKPKG